jgi:hypothetical protein
MGFYICGLVAKCEFLPLLLVQGCVIGTGRRGISRLVFWYFIRETALKFELLLWSQQFLRKAHLSLSCRFCELSVASCGLRLAY